MYRQGNYLLFILTAACLAGISILSACTNDLKKIQEISQKLVNNPVDTTRGVDIIFSDSAKVKAHIFSPLLLEYQKNGNTDRMIMPKGVKIIIYDNDRKERGTIIADTGYYFTDKKLIKFRKNVVITSVNGDVFEGQELNWDDYHNKLTSDKPFDITRADGTKGHALSLETNGKLDPIIAKGSNGLFFTSSDFGK